MTIVALLASVNALRQALATLLPNYVLVYRVLFSKLTYDITYTWLRARIGMVTLALVDVSEDASMWQRPSNIPPGSITRQGE